MTSNSILFRFPFRAVTFQTQRFGANYTYKTELQKSFIKNLEGHLVSRSQEIKKFTSLFDPFSDVLTGVWFFTYEDHFTKKNAVNSKCPDLENGKKMCQDVIFKSLGLNDKDICGTTDIKWRGSDEIIFQLNIVKREQFLKNIIQIQKIVLR